MNGTARFRGTHITTYQYSRPIFLAPHTVRLRPRPDPAQRVHDFAIEFEPEPVGVTSGLDAWGNNVVWAWFSGTHDRLEIRTRFDVERIRANPYDFVVPTAEGGTIPPSYSEDDRAALDPYLGSDDPGDDVRKLADEVADQVGGSVIDLAHQLAVAIKDRCEMIVRPEGDPYTGAQLLAEGRGSCRDMAVLYIEACRHVGIAARFVSGYVASDPDEPKELHAWAGIYVPGGGWRGFDPTQGLAVSTGHVTLAAAAVPAGAAPVTGSFAGDDASSELSSTVEFVVE